MQQPKLKARVQSSDGDVGEIRHVIVDPISLQISHVVIGDGAATAERQVPVDAIQSVTNDLVQLRGTSADLGRYPVFKRDDYVTTHEVEIAHLEDKIHVEPGDVLVPLPVLEKDVKRRTFFTAFINAIGVLIALPFVWPVLRYLMKPMYAPFDNAWLSIGNVNRIKTDDVGVQFKYKKKVKEAFMPETEIDKNVWIIKASPTVLEQVYKGKDMEFQDATGKVLWTNKATTPYIAYSGKCPHLGCGYKWRTHKVLGQVFLCPCHLSIYDAGGKVLDGPAPRPLDVLPMRVAANGSIEIIDMEFKAGTKSQIRIV
jgi:Rieske Fe-S protein